MVKHIICLLKLFIYALLLSGKVSLYAQNKNIIKLAAEEKYDFPYVKYTFNVHQQILSQNITIEQPLYIPEYDLNFSTSPVTKTCSIIQCKSPSSVEMALSKNQTWNGIFLPFKNKKLNSALSEEELAYKLSSTIKGLDPVFTNKIVKLGVLKKIKFKYRPKTWVEFQKFIHKLQTESKKLGFSHNFYNEVTSVYGYENAIFLDYYSEDKCSMTTMECQAENLEYLKTLVQETEKNLVIKYTPPTPDSDAFLYENEIDQFNIIIAKDNINNHIITSKLHNYYTITKEQSPENKSQIIFNITPLKRKPSPLPHNFLNVFSNNYANGIFFEWKIASKQYDSKVIQEMDNLYLHYKICRMGFLSCKIFIEEEIPLASLNLPKNPTKDDVLLMRLFIDKEKKKDMLKEMARYKVTSSILVRGSNKILGPEKKEQNQIIQYIPYDRK